MNEKYTLPVTLDGRLFTVTVWTNPRLSLTPVWLRRQEKYPRSLTWTPVGFAVAGADVLDPKSRGLFASWELVYADESSSPVFVATSDRTLDEVWAYFNASSGAPLVIVKFKRLPEKTPTFLVQVSGDNTGWVTIGKHDTEEEAENEQAAIEGYWSAVGITSRSRIVAE